MFTQILDHLSDMGCGIHGYRSAARAAFEAGAAHPDLMAAFYILGTSAEAFVERHERMPVQASTLSLAFRAFEESVMTLEQAHASGNADRMLDALNRVSRNVLRTL